MKVHYGHVTADDCEVFYRYAGNPAKPAILLLHGFPSSSAQYRELIPMLAEDFYVVAPDFPGFGQTKSPGRDKFDYTFDHIADIVEGFVKIIGLKKFSLFVFDYGAPIGFRIARRHPEMIEAIISQNGNIYEEGLGKKWEARKAYWLKPTPELRKQFETAYSPETIIGQYTFGTEPGSVSPDGYSLDIYYSGKPDYNEIQNDLILDYRSNVAMYPEFQKYLRENLPPLLAVWGKNDPSFIPAGAEAFKHDQPEAEVHLVNSGHFAVETHAREISDYIKDFLKRKLK